MVFGGVTTAGAVALIALFFLPWVRVSCTGQAVSGPSGYEFARGRPDQKTLTLLKALRFMNPQVYVETMEGRTGPDKFLLLYASVVVAVFGTGASMAYLTVARRLRARGRTIVQAKHDRPVPTSWGRAVFLLAGGAILLLAGFYLDRQPSLPPDHVVQWEVTLPFRLSGAVCLGLLVYGLLLVTQEDNRPLRKKGDTRSVPGSLGASRRDART